MEATDPLTKEVIAFEDLQEPFRWNCPVCSHQVEWVWIVCYLEQVDFPFFLFRAKEADRFFLMHQSLPSFLLKLVLFLLILQQ